MDRNRIFTVVTVLLAFAVVFGAWSPAMAQEEEQGQPQVQQGVHVGSGRQGAFIPSGTTNPTIHAHKLEKSEAGWVRGQIVGKPILLEAHGEAGNTIGNPNIRTYVFFNLRGGESRAWNRGDLSIYYKPAGNQQQGSQNWQTCSAFVVDPRSATQQAQQQGEEGGQQQAGQTGQTLQTAEDQQVTRIACLTTQYNAIYALVRTDRGNQ